MSEPPAAPAAGGQATNPPPDPSCVRIDGPWQHRDIGANGQRFHVVEAGRGPLVLLLHGFPQFWWCWRDQLAGLADSGFRAVAVDLRGYGASDKPPRGYDALTLSADVAGLVRALGERDAAIVGQDWGGFLGWTVGALHPAVVRRLVVLSSAHPRTGRRALLRPGAQQQAWGPVAAFQVPWRPERMLVADDAAEIGRLLTAWSGPSYPDAAVARYREHAQIPGVVHSALEYFRWSVRSLGRPDGTRFARAMGAPVAAPVLQLHGADDPFVLAATTRADGRWVRGPYERVELPGVGHFLPEEAPAEVTDRLVTWLRASA